MDEKEEEKPLDRKHPYWMRNKDHWTSEMHATFAILLDVLEPFDEEELSALLDAVNRKLY